MGGIGRYVNISRVWDMLFCDTPRIGRLFVNYITCGLPDKVAVSLALKGGGGETNKENDDRHEILSARGGLLLVIFVVRIVILVLIRCSILIGNVPYRAEKSISKRGLSYWSFKFIYK